MRIIWSDRARGQVIEIFKYIAEDRPMAAERTLEGFLDRVGLLAEFPDQGASCGGPQRPDLRFIIFESYRLVYRVRGEELVVLSVRHTRMRPDESPEDAETEPR